MEKNTVVGAVVLALALLSGACGCVTAKAPEKPKVVVIKEKAPPKKEVETCTLCLQVCWNAGSGELVCEEECKGGYVECKMHDARDRAKKLQEMRELLGPPKSEKPPHQNQGNEGEAEEAGKVFTL